MGDMYPECSDEIAECDEECLGNWMDNLDDCSEEFMKNANWEDFDGMDDCEIKMVCAAAIFECAAEGDEDAEDAVECFVNEPDCLVMVCFDGEDGKGGKGKGKGKGKIASQFNFDTAIAAKKVFGF